MSDLRTVCLKLQATAGKCSYGGMESLSPGWISAAGNLDEGPEVRLQSTGWAVNHSACSKVLACTVGSSD